MSQAEQIASIRATLDLLTKQVERLEAPEPRKRSSGFNREEAEKNYRASQSGKYKRKTK